MGPAGSPLLVENFRAAGRVVWSTREMGRPAPLDEALLLARLYTLGVPVDQAEIMILGNGTHRDRARRLRSLGWTMTIIYYKLGNVKIEHRFYALPLCGTSGSQSEWIALFREASRLTRDLAAHALILS